ncbi:response regulator [Candidatus Poribacteria bacterium]|nr:response regulator [Candidatus Poribacteria bacterium]MBT5710471.1 response regulator [Candidatus Poribacteria bacterium]MBT7100447.1 response regulator [Candidatus Poribacteria bacterium]
MSLDPAETGPAVLVASGSPLFSRALTRSLNAHGCAVTTTEHPPDVRDQLASGSVAVCLMQDSLSGKSGVELCGELSRDEATHAVPIIMFSRDAAVEATARDQGAAGFLLTPCRRDEAYEAVTACLSASAAPPPPTEATQPTPQPAPAAPEAAATVGPTRILLVDDSRVVHTHVGQILETAGHEVSHAMDGVEGLQRATDDLPDLIISDIEMPNMDGFEMCRRVKEDARTQRIPIVVLSSRGASVDMDRGFDVGANDYLTKPVDDNELLSRIEHIIGGAPDGAEKRERIVVAEDSLVQRNLIVQGLQQQGFEVIAARNGKEGLDFAVSSLPDLIITDCDMPIMDGRAFTRELRRREYLNEVPVVMLTAADSELDRTKGMHAGVNAFLSKPFVPDKIIVIAEKLIAERRLTREGQAMQRYLSDSAIAAAEAAAETIQDVRDVMHAERRFVTIYFTDIVGFTPMTESMEADALVDLLNQYFDAMTPLFQNNHGVIDKFVGDCIMGLFHGEDDDHGREESAYRAVKTGLEMTRGLEEFNVGRDPKINVRVGINSGDVIMGDIGAQLLRRDYTVIGDHVNIAARLESAAEHGTVLISESTYELVRDSAVVTQLGPIEVKGKSEPISVYRVDDLK